MTRFAGKRHTAASRQKISDSNMGREATYGMAGKSHSEAARQKMREAWERRKRQDKATKKDLKDWNTVLTLDDVKAMGPDEMDEIEMGFLRYQRITEDVGFMHISEGCLSVAPLSLMKPSGLAFPSLAPRLRVSRRLKVVAVRWLRQ
jgi:hypothetical protein